MKKTSVIIAVLLFFLSHAAIAADERALEAKLTKALALNKATNVRQGDADIAIKAYAKAGIINRKPNKRADYTDYFLLKKNATFLGHKIVVLEHEYMTSYVGCCVNPGIGLTLKVSANVQSLERFANTNGCKLSNNVVPQEELKSIGIKAKLSGGQYATLSCRENDIENK